VPDVSLSPPAAAETDLVTAASQAEQVRLLVARTFEELGARVPNELDLHETLLVENQSLLARSYRTDRMMAMWLVGAGVVQFYDDDGVMLRTVNLLKELRPRRAAA
jgi:hypothetical protein